MTFEKKHANILLIILGTFSVLSLFLPLYTAQINMYGLAGWRLNYSPLLGVSRESFGIWISIVNKISQAFNLIPPPNIFLIGIGFTMLFLSCLLIILGILGLKGRETFVLPVLVIGITVTMMFLLNFAYNVFFRVGIGTEITFPVYYISFNKSIFVAYLRDLIVIVPRIRDLFHSIGFYLIISFQIILLVLSLSIILTLLRKKRKKSHIVLR